MDRWRSVFRPAVDGLSRERWEFMHNGDYLVLMSYGIERRASAKGRFSKATASDRWEARDERAYNSRLPRPTTIPSDVIFEAAARTLTVSVGWTNEASKYCTVTLMPATTPQEIER